MEERPQRREEGNESGIESGALQHHLLQQHRCACRPPETRRAERAYCRYLHRRRRRRRCHHHCCYPASELTVHILTHLRLCRR